MNRKRIIIISLIIILTIVIVPPVLKAGSAFFDSPGITIFATLDFISTEKEFRETIESTQEAKLFRESFGENVKTQYWVELGLRKMILSTDESSLKFTQHSDRSIVIYYWCYNNDERISGYVTTFELLKESGCF